MSSMLAVHSMHVTKEASRALQVSQLRLAYHKSFIALADIENKQECWWCSDRLMQYILYRNSLLEKLAR